MNASEIVALFRTEMHDAELPYLISDAQAYTYLNDAQEAFVRELGGIPDASSAFLQIAANVNDTSFVYDHRILKIRGAFRLSDGREVDVIDYEEMRTRGLRFDGTTGHLQAIVIGMDDTTVRYLKKIDLADTLQLIVDRMPLVDIDVGAPNVAPEIDPRHHIHMITHMMAKAYDNQDTELFDKSKAVELSEKFMAYCVKCFKEKERRKHKTRVVQYGGIPFTRPTREDDYYRR